MQYDPSVAPPEPSREDIQLAEQHARETACPRCNAWLVGLARTMQLATRLTAEARAAQPAANHTHPFVPTDLRNFTPKPPSKVEVERAQAGARGGCKTCAGFLAGLARGRVGQIAIAQQQVAATAKAAKAGRTGKVR
jgi:hypothetical protein